MVHILLDGPATADWDPRRGLELWYTPRKRRKSDVMRVRRRKQPDLQPTRRLKDSDTKDVTTPIAENLVCWGPMEETFEGDTPMLHHLQDLEV